MTLPDVDRICAIIGRTRHKMVQAELGEAIKRGVKFIELRLDFLAKAVDFQRLLPLKKCPWVATLRRREDGGRWTGTELERKTIIRQAIVAGFDWIDLETDIAHEIPRFRDVKRIVSYHNLNEMPADLEAIYERMSHQDADVLKVVVTAQNHSDNLRLLNILRGAKKPTVGHCMGEIGFPSRMLSLKFGAPFTYAAFNKERGIAPGLPSIDELRRHYNIDQINADTRVFGLIGDPVGHSYSPLLHNAMYRLNGINGLYLPFRIPRGELQSTILAYEAIPVEGYSVTIPHKEGAAVLAKVNDANVKNTGAANTLVRKPEGFHSWNTDYDAAFECLHLYHPMGEDGVNRSLAQCHALVLGAGGAARTIAHALKKAGGQVVISSRTLDRAEALAKEVDGKAFEWEGRHSINCEIVVNCTPVGMHPNVDDSPIHKGFLKPGMMVFDTVYNPETTLLVKDARARGCTVITGVEMFVRQAALQFQLFTGMPAAVNVLREEMRRALSPVTLKAQAETDEE
jgi:3-dehydroquinate dehydratase / shikimate dehydrogenase